MRLLAYIRSVLDGTPSAPSSEREPEERPWEFEFELIGERGRIGAAVALAGARVQHELARPHRRLRRANTVGI